ncbi:MAG: P-type ATPase, partial [Isosphaeraceae bacterium]
MTAADPRVSFPSPGVIRVHNRELFGDADGSACRAFLERVFLADGVRSVSIRGGRAPYAEIRHASDAGGSLPVLERIVALLRQPTAPAGEGERRLPSPYAGRTFPPPASTARDHRGFVRYYRHGRLVSGWETRLDRPGRLRLRNRALHRRSGLCRAVEREMMGVLGVEHCRASSNGGTVLIVYDPEQLNPVGLIETLDVVLAGIHSTTRTDPLDLHLPLATANLPIAALAQTAVPALVPAAVALIAFTTFRSIREATLDLVRRRGRPGPATLDAAVLIGCLGTMSILPGAVLGWCATLGRTLIARAENDSRRVLLGSFGKRLGAAWLWRDGTEIRVAADRLQAGDHVIATAGEFVPADGRIVAGRALVDEHALTGEATPVERRVGDRLHAATLLMAGEVIVLVEAAGRRTAAAEIGRILEQTAGYRSEAQRRGERIAADAVLPALALGAVGMAVIGPSGALAVLHRDLDTGPRMAMPLALVSSLARCAHLGILVKDGRALEVMGGVDTLLLDQSAVLARGRPGDGRFIEELRARGIREVGLVSGHGEEATARLAALLGADRSFAEVTLEEKAALVERLRAEGRRVCFVGDGLHDAAAMRAADVSVSASVRGPAAVADDAAQVVLLDGGLSRLCDLFDTSRDLDRSIRRTWAIVLIPNVACVIGAFTMGFGLLVSVAANNLAA